MGEVRVVEGWRVEGGGGRVMGLRGCGMWEVVEDKGITLQHRC